MGLTKRSDSWYVEFRVIDDGQVLRLAGPGEGKLKRWKTGTHEKRLAEKQESILKTRLLAGDIKSPSLERPLSFGDWVARYLALPEVRALRSYRRLPHVLRRFADRWTGRTLSSIRPEDVYAYRAARLADGDRVGTVNYEHAVLKACLNVAVRLRVLSYNPASLVPMPDPRNARKRVLSSDEFDKIRHALRQHPVLWAAFLLGYDGGLRVGEIGVLTVAHVSPDITSITLHDHETKTREGRVVPLSDRASLALRAVMPVSGRIFPTDRYLSTAFSNVFRQLGLEDLRFHDTRHCARTNLRRAGVDTETIMKWLGHKTMVMSLRYDTVEDCDLAKARHRLNAVIAGTERSVGEEGREQQEGQKEQERREEQEKQESRERREDEEDARKEAI